MKTESIKRSRFMMFLNTTPAVESATYALIGNGVTELSIDYGAQTKTEQYINADSASTEVTGYQPTAPVTMTAKKGDPVFTFINELRRKRAILSDAYSDIIMADAYDVVNADDLTAIPAEKQPISIQIGSYGGPAEEPLSIDYTINFRGNSEAGTFDATSKTFALNGETQTSGAQDSGESTE